MTAVGQERNSKVEPQPQAGDPYGRVFRVQRRVFQVPHARGQLQVLRQLKAVKYLGRPLVGQIVVGRLAPVGGSDIAAATSQNLATQVFTPAQ